MEEVLSMKEKRGLYRHLDVILKSKGNTIMRVIEGIEVRTWETKRSKAKVRAWGIKGGSTETRIWEIGGGRIDVRI